jgi:hypothetical protein
MKHFRQNVCSWIIKLENFDRMTYPFREGAVTLRECHEDLALHLTKLDFKWFATVLRPGSHNWRRPGRGQRIKRSAGLIILLICITAPRPPVSNQFRPNTASSKIQNISFATLLFLLLSIGRNKNNTLLLIMLIAERCSARESKLSRSGRREKDPAAAEKNAEPIFRAHFSTFAHAKSNLSRAAAVRRPTCIQRPVSIHRRRARPCALAANTHPPEKGLTAVALLFLQ